MNELAKVKRVMDKVIPGAPHEVLLVLDGSTGQNAFQQAQQFTKATEVTSLAITKLDGTAKGGVICALSKALEAPMESEPIGSKIFVYALGKGEGIEDLELFKADAYAKELI